MIPNGPDTLIWLINVISPSSFEGQRFHKLAQDLAELNIGVICCPSAAISLRQLRSLRSFTHKSIAGVLELAAAGGFVRIGSDNVCDITSPAGTLDLMEELFVLSNAMRFYDIEFLAHLGARKRIPDPLCKGVKRHLAEDQAQCEIAVAHYDQMQV